MDILHPTPEEMTTALLEAAKADQWNHWQHEVEQHADDWLDARGMRRPLIAEEFAQLPAIMASYPFVELCVYGYKYHSRPVWGFYARKLPFQGWILPNVLVVYDPVAEEIIHCMYSLHKKHYCERWGEQTHLFFGVRW